MTRTFSGWVDPRMGIAGGRGAASECRSCSVGATAEPFGTGSGDSRACEMDVSPNGDWSEHRRDRSGTQRPRCRLSVGRGSGRNPHRSGAGWTMRTVATILANPPLHGRQVWNRQRTEYECAGDTTSERVSPKGRQQHIAVEPARRLGKLDRNGPSRAGQRGGLRRRQTIRAVRPTHDGAPRIYLLAGLLVCGHCGRRMDAHWVNSRPGYRCRHGRTTAKQPAAAIRRICTAGRTVCSLS